MFVFIYVGVGGKSVLGLGCFIGRCRGSFREIEGTVRVS